jgi:hypothetical protein
MPPFQLAALAVGLASGVGLYGIADDRRSGIEGVLRGRKVRFEARTMGPDELEYEVRVPARTRPDRVSNAILALDHDGKIEVEWDEKTK